MPILQWLGITPAGADGAGPDGLDEIERQLDTLDPGRARYVASFAYLLGRVARADHDISPAETATMEQLVGERGGLAPEDAALAVRIATAHGLRFGGTEDFLVAREFSATATREQKLALLDCLFAVSASDHSIRTVEDNEIRRIASEMRIGHDDFIAVRQAWAGHLEVLRHRGAES
ncbi:MAG: TerB family tellurite resistance protein [Vicinamibacterales bacterium]